MVSISEQMHVPQPAVQEIPHSALRRTFAAAMLAAAAWVAFHAAAADESSSRHFDDAARWAAVFDYCARRMAAPAIHHPRPGTHPGRHRCRHRRGHRLLQRTSRAGLAPRQGIRRGHRAGDGRSLARSVRRRGRLLNVVAIQASRDSPNLPEPVDAVLLVNVQSLVANPGDYFVRLKSRLKPGARVAIVSTRPDA